LQDTRVFCQDCRLRLGEVDGMQVRFDLWRLRFGNREGSATEYLVCYMLHQVVQNATHKFTFLSSSREGLLVMRLFESADVRYGCFHLKF